MCIVGTLLVVMAKQKKTHWAMRKIFTKDYQWADLDSRYTDSTGVSDVVRTLIEITKCGNTACSYKQVGRPCYRNICLRCFIHTTLWIILSGPHTYNPDWVVVAATQYIRNFVVPI
jgi:hypothetical protein